MKGKLKLLTFGLAVASVGMLNSKAMDVQSWTDLASCLKGAETECKLTTSVENQGESADLVINISGSKTLDLNGQTLTFNKPSVDTRFTIESGNSLTIKGGTIVKSSDADASTIVTVRKGGTLVVEEGAILDDQKNDNMTTIGIFGSTTDDASDVTKVTINGTVNGAVGVAPAVPTDPNAAFGVEVVVGGTINSTEGDALTINGAINKTGTNVPKITINETARIIGNGGPGIYAAGYGIWNILGGYIEGSEGIAIKAGEVNISGGEIYANGEYVETESIVANGIGPDSTGSAISITSTNPYAGKIKLNITGDVKVKSENGYAILEAVTDAGESYINDIAISDGTYEGAIGAFATESEDKFEGKISGGEFINQELDTKFLSVGNGQSSSGKVGKVHTIIDETTDKENGQLTIQSDAIADEEVSFELTVNDGYEATVSVINALTNEEITVTDNKFTMPDADVKIKVTYTEKPVVDEGNTGDSDPTTDKEDSDNNNTGDNTTTDENENNNNTTDNEDENNEPTTDEQPTDETVQNNPQTFVSVAGYTVLLGASVATLGYATKKYLLKK